MVATRQAHQPPQTSEPERPSPSSEGVAAEAAVAELDPRAVRRLVPPSSPAARLLRQTTIRQIQRTHGNRHTQRILQPVPVLGAAGGRSGAPASVQRNGPTDAGVAPQAPAQTPTQQVIAALQKPDPIAGVGDYPAAFRVLDPLWMVGLLDTLAELKRLGHFETLRVNLGQAGGVNGPRLQAAFKAVELKGSVSAEQFAAEQANLLTGLPQQQQDEIAAFLSGKFGNLTGASDKELGAAYDQALQGDPARLDAVENEIDKRERDKPGFGTMLPAEPPVSATGTSGMTKVTADVALKILENASKGEPPFRPDLGKGGASWFVTEGSPHIGVSPTKNIPVEVAIANVNDGLVFTEAELDALHEAEARATEAEAMAKYRQYLQKEYGIDPAKPLSNRRMKDFRQWHKKFAESRMWDRVGEQVAKSSKKVGKVILQNSKYSKQGNGTFAVVADPAKIKLKGGHVPLVEALAKEGVAAEPVVVEAAEALAKKMKWAGRVRAVFRYGGRVLIVVAIAADAVKIYQAQDRVKAVVESAGGWAGATAGAAAFAAWWTPADVAGPWAWVAHGVGTLVSGAIGYWIGSEVTRTIYELTVEP